MVSVHGGHSSRRAPDDDRPMESVMQRFDTPAPISAEARPAGRSAFGSFARFVLLGGGVGLASSAAVPLVATLMPWVAANALITVASTLLCTELHARFTFGAGRRAQWHEHLQSAGSATAAYLVTSAAILVLHVVQPSASMRWEQAVYLSASGLAGTGRFLVLRLYVFACGRSSSPPSRSMRTNVPSRTPMRWPLRVSRHNATVRLGARAASSSVASHARSWTTTGVGNSSVFGWASGARARG
jgi:putative flippase GtrA